MFSLAFFTVLVVWLAIAYGQPEKADSLGRTADNSWSLKTFKSLVTFGDSYTDESRALYYYTHGNVRPPVGWRDPVNNSTASGGYIWPRYVSWYSRINLYNYAVSGSVCSTKLIPRVDSILGVQDYEVPAFLADQLQKGPDGSPVMNTSPNTTVYAVWLGANDLGVNGLLTDSQAPGSTTVDYVSCIYDVFDQLYKMGARRFVLMNVPPLNRAPIFALSNQGGVGRNKYWPNKPANNTTVSYRMRDEVAAANEGFRLRTPFEMKLAGRYAGARMAVFDINLLFTDILDRPSQYLNGSEPANVTSYVNICDPTGLQCAQSLSPDSYMWYDELHPSEQTDRIIAKEFLNIVNGTSKYAAYW